MCFVRISKLTAIISPISLQTKLLYIYFFFNFGATFLDFGAIVQYPHFLNFGPGGIAPCLLRAVDTLIASDSYLRLSVRDKTLCQIFIKYCIKLCYKKSWTKRDFRENWFSDCHTLLWGVNEFILALPIFFNGFGFKFVITYS